jgi:hypothetical protein
MRQLPTDQVQQVSTTFCLFTIWGSLYIVSTYRRNCHDMKKDEHLFCNSNLSVFWKVFCSYCVKFYMVLARTHNVASW